MRKRLTKRSYVLVGLLFLFLGVALCVAVSAASTAPPTVWLLSLLRSSSPCGRQSCADIATSQIPIGTERHEALQKVPGGAWYHGECNEGNSRVSDVFLYGARNPDEVNVVVIHFKPEDGKYVVEAVGAMENYKIFSFGCLSPQVFE